MPPDASRASSRAYVASGSACCRWTAAPMPDSPAPTTTTSRWSDVLAVNGGSRRCDWRLHPASAKRLASRPHPVRTEKRMTATEIARPAIERALPSTPPQRRRARGAHGRPRLRPRPHRPHGRDPVGRRAGLARRASQRVRAAAARPVGDGPALRPGDLRGAQGLPAARRRRGRLPARGERPALQPLRAPASRCPSCRSSCSSRPSTRSSTPTARGCRPPRGRASTCGRS